MEWIGVIQKLNDNQSLCNSLIKRKADELLKVDNKVEEDKKSGKSKIKEYKPEPEYVMNSQYGTCFYFP